MSRSAGAVRRQAPSMHFVVPSPGGNSASGYVPGSRVASAGPIFAGGRRPGRGAKGVQAPAEPVAPPKDVGPFPADVTWWRWLRGIPKPEIPPGAHGIFESLMVSGASTCSISVVPGCVVPITATMVTFSTLPDMVWEVMSSDARRYEPSFMVQSSTKKSHRISPLSLGPPGSWTVVRAPDTKRWHGQQRGTYDESALNITGPYTIFVGCDQDIPTVGSLMVLSSWPERKWVVLSNNVTGGVELVQADCLKHGLEPIPRSEEAAPRQWTAVGHLHDQSIMSFRAIKSGEPLTCRAGPGLAEDELVNADWLYPPPRRFLLIVRIRRLMQRFSCEDTISWMRSTPQGGTKHVHVLDLVLWDSLTTPVVHLYQFGPHFDVTLFDRMRPQDWVKYRESFCIARGAIPTFNQRRPLKDLGRSAALAATIPELLQVAMRRVPVQHLMLRFMSGPGRSGVFEPPGFGLMDGILTLPDTIRMLEAVGDLSPTGVVDILDLSSLPCTARLELARLLQGSVRYLCASTWEPGVATMKPLDKEMHQKTSWDWILLKYFYPQVMGRDRTLQQCLTDCMNARARRWPLCAESLRATKRPISYVVLDLDCVGQYISAIMRGTSEARLSKLIPTVGSMGLEHVEYDIQRLVGHWQLVPERRAVLRDPATVPPSVRRKKVAAAGPPATPIKSMRQMFCTFRVAMSTNSNVLGWPVAPQAILDVAELKVPLDDIPTPESRPPFLFERNGVLCLDERTITTLYEEDFEKWVLEDAAVWYDAAQLYADDDRVPPPVFAPFMNRISVDDLRQLSIPQEQNEE